MSALQEEIKAAVKEALAELLPELMDRAAPKKLMNMKESATFMGRSAGAVRNMICSRQIPERIVKRFGKRVFLDRHELEKWLKAH